MKKNKALIIGASSGIGFQLAQDLLLKNYQVLIVSKNKKRLTKSFDALKKIDENNCFYKSIDISNEKEIKTLINFIKKKNFYPSILVHCAANIGPIGETRSIASKEWEKSIHEIINGTFYILKNFSNFFINNKIQGKIFVLSGGGSTNTFPNFASYACAKTAVARMVEIFSDELRDKYKILIYSIAPGIVQSNMQKQVLSKGRKIVGEKYFDKLDKSLNSNKIDTTPKDVISLINYLINNKKLIYSGRILSAKWDNFKSKMFLKKLKDKNKFKLRRVV